MNPFKALTILTLIVASSGCFSAGKRPPAVGADGVHHPAMWTIPVQAWLDDDFCVSSLANGDEMFGSPTRIAQCVTIGDLVRWVRSQRRAHVEVGDDTAK
jgi:hypothetical protein